MHTEGIQSQGLYTAAHTPVRSPGGVAALTRMRLPMNSVSFRAAIAASAASAGRVTKPKPRTRPACTMKGRKVSDHAYDHSVHVDHAAWLPQNDRLHNMQLNRLHTTMGLWPE